jgi:hypothetical protein
MNFNKKKMLCLIVVIYISLLPGPAGNHVPSSANQVTAQHKRKTCHDFHANIVFIYKGLGNKQ